MNLATRVKLLPRLVATCQPRANFSVSSSARASNVDVSIDDKGIATLSMNKAPVNSLSKEFLTDLCQLFHTSD